MMNKLKKDIKNGEVILFVGAGVSNTINLPTWSELIDYIATDLGYDETIFSCYGDALTLAEYYKINKGHIGELRSWMDTQWNVDDNVILNSTVHSAIVNMNFPIIYTTNYDHCLEKAFSLNNKEYTKIISVDDLVNIKKNSTQIIKFHGDTISDSSIVLAESDYFERLAFESPLDIKLRADMLSKSILFLGYSLSDINIRILIYKLDQLWKKSNNNSNRPQSYIFLPTPNPIQEKVLRARGVIPIVGESIDKKESIERFLDSLK